MQGLEELRSPTQENCVVWNVGQAGREAPTWIPGEPVRFECGSPHLRRAHEAR